MAGILRVRQPGAAGHHHLFKQPQRCGIAFAAAGLPELDTV